MRNHKGWTLVEFVAMLLVMGVLGVSMATGFADTNTFRSGMTFQQAYAFMRYANQVAVTIGCDVEVQLSGRTLTAKARANCSNNTGAFTQDLRSPFNANQVGIAMTIDSQITLSETGIPFYFTPLGQVFDSSTNVLATSDPTLTLNSRTITVVPETGFVYE